MNMPHLIKSALFGLACLGLGSTAQAAVVGGASVDITNGVFLSATAPGGYDIDITGDFFAESLIADFDAVRTYRVSADFTLNNDLILDEAALLPPMSINDILDFATGSGLAALFAPVLTQNPGAIEILGVDVDYSYSDIVTTANSVSGMFAIGLLLPQGAGNLLGLASPTDGATFSASLAIAPVPVPAALPLALGGFALLGFMGWRRRAAA